MRRSFHHQLAKVRKSDPFNVLDREFFTNSARTIREQRFAPLYGKHVKVQIMLDLVLLTGTPERKSALSSGDLDNRLKRIIDALRMPSQADEVYEDPISPDTCYCLMDDDSGVSSVSAKLGPFLGSNDPEESFVFIKARGTPEAVTLENLALLF